MSQSEIRLTRANDSVKSGVFRRLLQYVKPHRKAFLVAFVMLLIATTSDVVTPMMTKTFIDNYLTPRYFPTNPLVLIGGGYLLFHFAAVLFNYLQMIAYQKIALRIIQQLRIDVFTKVQRLGLSFFDRTPTGSLVSRITNDTEAVKDMYVSVLSTFLQNGVFLIGIYISMFVLNATLAAWCLLLLPLIFVIMHIYRKLSSKMYHVARQKLSILNAKLSESLQGMYLVQAMRQEGRLGREFGAVNREHNVARMKVINMNSLLLRPMTDLIYLIALVTVLSFFGVKSFHSHVEIGVFYVFLNYLDRIFEPINTMLMRLNLFQQALVSAERVFELLDEATLAPTQEGDEAPEIEQGFIEFKDVSFSYDGRTDVLKNITFAAYPGQTVALVGHTGSGKSSIINLLMRFYPVNRGTIQIDGHSLSAYENQELRAKMGLVLQDPFLFVGDVAKNIRLGNTEITDDEVKQAADFVQASPFIEKLPNKYSEVIGERGATFSSGQRQLLSFARTIAHNPKILVLDEATASIDTETEEAIQNALEKMRKGRTTIAIAHRLSTIQDADLILVLHHGEIVERGNHQELLAHEGLYHKMYLLQQGGLAMNE